MRVNNTIKEVLVSIVSGLLTGFLGLSLLNLTQDQSIALTLFTTVFLFVIFLLHRGFIVSPQVDESTLLQEHDGYVPFEEYSALEKKYDEALAKAEKFEKENKTTELFLASMSHELRTPLNGIVGLTELLDGTELTQEQKEFTSMIRESSENLRVIVNDILDISKINAGKMELENIPFDIYTKIEASVGVFVPKIEEKGIILNLFTDPKIPQYLIGDPTRLSQVIINLVSNAVKFTERDGKIDVYAEHIETKKDLAIFKVSVRDSGIGLTPEQQKRIFDAYSQAEASTTRKAGGTGLGLTISSRIIASMGGKLQVESQKGKGAVFFFTLALPLAKESKRMKRKSYPDLNVAGLLSEFNPKSEWKSILKTYVSNHGASFQAYDSLEDAVASSPDVLIVDQTALDAYGLDQFKKGCCRLVLLTSSRLQSKLEEERKLFDEIIYMPVTYEKIGKVLDFETDKLHHTTEKTPKTRTDTAPVKQFKDLRILVAEDNPINQKLIKVVLENFGLNVTLVGNGVEAVEARKNGTYDMIFMDIQMPEMGGVEATHLILEYEKQKGVPHIPIIALTANALTGDKEKYLAEGMDNYTTKPLDIKAIEKLISEYCNVK
jgi:signal transduction histidine kinase/CheY-like chemotaxis protein